MYFVSYEHLRDLAAADGAFGAPGDKAALPPLVSASAATLAATLATIATNPIDVVKTRLQALPGGAGSAGGALGVARAMFAAEGAAVFGAGLAARVLSIAPGSFISFFAFETCRAAFAAREAQRDADDDAGREMPLRRIEL
jgi:solute carrier family 25 citrate transporter 1